MGIVSSARVCAHVRALSLSLQQQTSASKLRISAQTGDGPPQCLLNVSFVGTFCVWFTCSNQ